MQGTSNLSGKKIAISISDSPDLRQLGLGSQHLYQAMAEIAQHLLAAGAHLIYGGDLRAGGFTSVLFELAARYHDKSKGNQTIFTNYLPWAAHIFRAHHELLAIKNDIEPYGELVLLSIDGQKIPQGKKKNIPNVKASPGEWAACLTAMRTVVSDTADARILLGGNISGFLGAIPGIAEEAQISIRMNKPTYVLGGFGGCAGDIVETMSNPRLRSKRAWIGRKYFKTIKVDDLQNGLSQQQNEDMWSTSFIETIIPYLLCGLDLKLNGDE